LGKLCEPVESVGQDRVKKASLLLIKELNLNLTFGRRYSKKLAELGLKMFRLNLYSNSRLRNPEPPGSLLLYTTDQMRFSQFIYNKGDN
jgi:hypothetical protein